MSEETNVGKYSEFVNVDPANLDDVIKAIRLALDTDKFVSNEERLYAFGLVLDKNKAVYINSLRTELKKAREKNAPLNVAVQQLESKINKLEKEKERLTAEIETLKAKAKGSPAPNPVPQKKVYVVKRRPLA